jgi:hypothetical protein
MDLEYAQFCLKLPVKLLPKNGTCFEKSTIFLRICPNSRIIIASIYGRKSPGSRFQPPLCIFFAFFCIVPHRFHITIAPFCIQAKLLHIKLVSLLKILLASNLVKWAYVTSRTCIVWTTRMVR